MSFSSSEVANRSSRSRTSYGTDPRVMTTTNLFVSQSGRSRKGKWGTRGWSGLNSARAGRSSIEELWRLHSEMRQRCPGCDKQLARSRVNTSCSGARPKRTHNPDGGPGGRESRRPKKMICQARSRATVHQGRPQVQVTESNTVSQRSPG